MRIDYYFMRMHAVPGVLAVPINFKLHSLYVTQLMVDWMVIPCNVQFHMYVHVPCVVIFVFYGYLYSLY